MAVRSRPDPAEALGAYAISAEVIDLEPFTRVSVGAPDAAGNGYVVGCSTSGCALSRLDALASTSLDTAAFSFTPTNRYQLASERSGPLLDQHEAPRANKT